MPLDLFGIELAKVIEIIANAPLRVGAFISTLVDLSRNFSLREENFYHGALRSYQEMHYNYFESIEEAALRFSAQYKIPTDGSVSVHLLADILQECFGYKIIENGLVAYPELHHLRSVFVPRNKRLLLNEGLNEIQQAFQYAKELGFQFLELKERASSSSLVKVNSFEEVLNHFMAAYFGVAILINRDSFIVDLQSFFGQAKWDGQAFLSLMNKYHASPEMLFQRLTNIIPEFFGLEQMFFLRFKHDPETDDFQIDKELHLNRRHHPHGNQINEHYCRRWMSLLLLKDLHQMQSEGKYAGTIVGAQRSRYFGTEDEYLCLTLARPGAPTPNKNVSVTLGFLINQELKSTINFWNDPALNQREVHTTCERCPIEDCHERAQPALIIEKRNRRRKVEEAIRQIIGD